MELVKEHTNGRALPDVRPISNAEREAVRAQRGKSPKVAPVIKPAGPFLEQATMKALNDLWPWINQGLLRLKKKDPNSGTWTPQHVRSRIELGLAGQAPVQMWFVKTTDKPATSDNKPLGFFCATGYPDPYLAVPYVLWIWLAVGEPLQSRKVLKKVVEEIKKFGRSTGYAKIQWGTGRMNWAPLARALGFEPIQVIWEMEL
jgi:hypothetical protein